MRCLRSVEERRQVCHGDTSRACQTAASEAQSAHDGVLHPGRLFPAVHTLFQTWLIHNSSTMILIPLLKVKHTCAQVHKLVFSTGIIYKCVCVYFFFSPKTKSFIWTLFPPACSLCRGCSGMLMCSGAIWSNCSTWHSAKCQKRFCLRTKSVLISILLPSFGGIEHFITPPAFRNDISHVVLWCEIGSREAGAMLLLVIFFSVFL